jgi:hypothetical protein
MSNVYEVKLPNASATVFIEAKSKNQARTHAQKGTTVRKLDTGEAMRLMREGKTIEQAGDDTADSGNDDKEAEPADPTTATQQSLPIVIVGGGAPVASLEGIAEREGPQTAYMGVDPTKPGDDVTVTREVGIGEVVAATPETLPPPRKRGIAARLGLSTE